VGFHKPVLSPADPLASSVAMITDGRKDGDKDACVELPPGRL